MQHFNQFFKRCILMCIGSQHHLAYTCQKSPKRWSPTKTRAQHQEIDKKANQRFSLGPVTIGNICTDNNVFLATVAIEQRLESCQQHHEQSYTLLTTKDSNLRKEVRRERESIAGSMETLYCWARMI